VITFILPPRERCLGEDLFGFKLRDVRFFDCSREGCRIISDHEKSVFFVLTCRVELDPGEQELVSKYKAYDQVLIHKGSEKISELTIANLINGITEEFSDMATMIKNEEVIKKACQSFKNRLSTMANFGEQVIEY
jgi:hypothetical protein